MSCNISIRPGRFWFTPLYLPEGQVPELLSVKVPSDKHVLVPLTVSWSCADTPDDGLVADAQQGADLTVSLGFSVDEFSIPEAELLANHREQGGLFSYEFSKHDPPASGYCGLDGYWVMLEPLPPGEHLIERTGEFSNLPQEWDAPINITSVLPGDLDADGLLSAADIDSLADAIGTDRTDVYDDVNWDGTVDLDDHAHWVKSLAQTWFGDANLDSEFNSGDLVAVFSAGEYEDALEDNSGWAEGDWDGDGDFTSGDLVAAFTDGGYEQGPRPAASLIPEPTSLVLVLIGLSSIAVCRRKGQGRGMSYTIGCP